MNKSKLLALCLAGLMGLSACGDSAGSAQSGEDSTSSVSSSNPTKSIQYDQEQIGGSITVSCYDATLYQSFLEEAAQLFEAKYPDTKVNIETFSAMPDVKTSEQGDGTIQTVEAQDDPQGRADYISKISTALMSGEGADIFAADVLPLYKLVSSGQLLDLNAFMESDTDFNRADYRTNILDAAKIQGGSYFLPLDYMFDYYTYDSTLVSSDAAANLGDTSSQSAKSLIDLAIPMFDGSTRLFNEPDNVEGNGLFQRLFNEQYDSFVDIANNKANFEDGSFASLLEQVKGYTDMGYIPNGLSSQMDAEAMMQQMTDGTTERYLFKVKGCFSLSQHYNEDPTLKMSIQTGVTLSGLEDDDEIAGISANQDGTVPFTFNQAYAINANSQNPHTAWAFLKFLLSEEMQLSTTLLPLGLPLHNEARTQKTEFIVSGSYFGLSGEMSEGQKETLRLYRETMEKLSDRIDTYEIQDTVISDMVAEETQYFFSSDKSASEVATVLQNKVSLYLSE